MIELEEILTTFEEEKDATVMSKSADLFDKVTAECGWTEASSLWSHACNEYDRRHMTEEEYAANYGEE